MAKSVTVYSTSTCPFCIRAKQFLKDNNIAFEDIDVAENHETLIHTVYVDKPIIETVTVSVDKPVYITRTVYETKTVPVATDIKKLHLAILTLRARYLLLAAKYKKLAKR